MYIKAKHRNKKHFCRYYFQCFSEQKILIILIEHKKICLNINGKQNVKLRNGLIKLNNHYKQLAAPLKFSLTLNLF